MRLRRTTLSVVGLVAVLVGTGTAGAFVVTFDGLSAGTTYQDGDTFTNGLASIDVVGLSPTGTAQVVASSFANGSANEMLLSSAGLLFDNEYMTGLSFQYLLPADTGNTTSLRINGSSVVTGSNFVSQTLGGVQVFVTSFATPNGTLGAVFMTGPISSVMFGAGRMYLDNVIASVPEPATLALLSLGGMLALRRRT